MLGAARFAVGALAQVVVIGGLYVFLAKFAVTHLPATPEVWIGFFVVGDFYNYVMHRASHRIPVLWAAHVVHHSSEDFNLTAAARLSPVEALWHPLLGFWIPLVGVPISVAASVTTFNLVFALCCHTDAVARLGVLDRWLVTPSAHRVHHARNPQYIDKNFGTVLMVWDRLFNTYQAESEPVEFGVIGQFDRSSVWRVALGNYPRLWATSTNRLRSEAPSRSETANLVHKLNCSREQRLERRPHDFRRSENFSPRRGRVQRSRKIHRQRHGTTSRKILRVR